MLKKDSIVWYLKDESLKNVLKSQHFGWARAHKIIELAGNNRIFVKCFVEKGIFGYLRNFFSPRGKKEFETYERLKDLAIETPKGLGYGLGSLRSFSVWEYVEAETYLKKFKKAKDRSLLLKILAEFLKELKSKKVRHDDLHLDNLLIVDGRLILVDFHKVKIKKRFGKKDEISNISYALHTLYDELRHDELQVFFNFYGDPSIRGSVEKKIEDLRRSWIQRKLKRSDKTTSLVLSQNGFRFLKGFEGVREGNLVELIKEDRKVTLLRYSNCVKKIYKSRRRLKRAWANSVVFEYLGTRIVPRAFAMRLPSFRSHGFILMEDLKKQGGFELDRFLDQTYERMEETQRLTLLKDFSAFLLKLIKLGIFHKDFKGCNIFFVPQVGFYLLDVEDIVFKKLGWEELASMLSTLNNTIPKKVSIMDRLRIIASIDALSKEEKRKLIKKVTENSKEREIVYVGKEGLVFKRWEV
ncbi:MAG: lipopolysaccharide kinase InaA family protein [Deltaproteobacteria bacterium]|nr:lipopolysaccharide kinase InaA family protein [Deltaproteobacteria bacterium]